jgi:hypothetical protein
MKKLGSGGAPGGEKLCKNSHFSILALLRFRLIMIKGKTEKDMQQTVLLFLARIFVQKGSQRKLYNFAVAGFPPSTFFAPALASSSRTSWGNSVTRKGDRRVCSSGEETRSA